MDALVNEHPSSLLRPTRPGFPSNRAVSGDDVRGAGAAVAGGRWLPGEGGAQLLGEMFNRPQRKMAAMLGWGVLFGGFFGAGVGYAIYYCQRGVRIRLQAGIPLKVGG